MRHLKRIFSARGHSHRKAYSDLLDLDKLATAGQLHRYWWMYAKCGEQKYEPMSINGGIDGSSREIICLNAYGTGTDPKLIGRYYIEAVKHLGGCPRVVRGDVGTENGYGSSFQRFLLPIYPDDTLDSYLEHRQSKN